MGTSHSNHHHVWPTITSTLLGAGFETTVTTLSWILFELATHPDEQRQLRDEIYSAQAANDAEAVKFDSLPFLNAVIKVNLSRVCELDSWLNIHRSDNQETMRYDTVIPHLFREATRDDVIPLTAKVFCRSGNVVEHLPIPRGTQIIISDVAYHRWACQIPHYILNLTDVLQEQGHMGRRRRYLEAEQMVGWDGPVIRNQSGCMVQFVRHRNILLCQPPSV